MSKSDKKGINFNSYTSLGQPDTAPHLLYLAHSTNKLKSNSNKYLSVKLNWINENLYNEQTQLLVDETQFMDIMHEHSCTGS